MVDSYIIETPSFLKTVNKTQCQTHGRGQYCFTQDHSNND